MADLCVKASGSNTAPYETWAKAATTLETATLAAGVNDNIYMDSAMTITPGSTNYTPAAGVHLYSTNDTTNVPPTTYAKGAFINTATTALVNINSGHWFGFRFDVGSGSSSANLTFGAQDNKATSLDDCDFTLGNTSVNSSFQMGPTSGSSNSALRTRNCNFTFGATGQGFQINGGLWRDEGSNLDAGGTHPVTLFEVISTLSSSIELLGSNLSGNANTYFAAATVAFRAVMVNCKLHASATIQAALSVDESGEIFGYDCDSGDTHYKLFHYNYRGNTVVSTAKYVTADGAAWDGATSRYSWTVTSANGIFGAPYYSPWIERYNSSLTSLTPYFEIVRDGSATAYNDDEVWAEFAVKTTSGFPISTFVSDRKTPLATAAAQANGAGTGAWTGLGGTAKSMKVDAGAAQTFAEIGVIRGRIALTGTVSVQLDPKIRGMATDSTLERVAGAAFGNGFASGGSVGGGLHLVGSGGLAG